MSKSMSDAILYEGNDDWVSLANMEGLARTLAPNAAFDEIKQEILESVVDLHRQGLVRFGIIDAAQTIVWSDEAEKWLAIFDAKYQAVGREYIWLQLYTANTPAGEALGKLVVLHPLIEEVDLPDY